MEQELIDYLIREHSNRLIGPDMLALRHLLHDEKLAVMDNAASREKYRAIMLRAGWLSEDEKVLSLLQDGIPAFRRRIAQQLYNEYGGETLLNNCPRCHRLARTSRAQQCRHCGHDWH